MNERRTTYPTAPPASTRWLVAACVALAAWLPGSCLASASSETTTPPPLVNLPNITAGFGSSVPVGAALLPSNIETRSSEWMRAYASGNDTTASAKEVDQPYAKSVWLNAGIKLVTSQLSRVSFSWFADEELTNPAPVQPDRAAFWRRPSTRMGEPLQCTDTIEAMAGWALLAGEVCIVLPEDWISNGRTSRVSPFRVVSPARLSAVRARYDGEIVGWILLDHSGRQETLIPAQVIRSCWWNPYDDCRGLGAYDPMRMEVAADYYASRYARNTAASNGQQLTYITTDGQGVTPQQQEQIIAALREKSRRVANGDFAPAFLNGGLKVNDAQARSVDAQFVAARIENRHAIAAALGIPMSMFDVAASYSVGAASDLYRLITCTCEPFAMKIADVLERIEEARTAQMLFAGFNWSEHPVMQEARMARFASAVAAHGTGIPWSVLNDTLKLQLPEFIGHDSGFLPFSVQTVEQVMAAPEVEPEPAEIQPEETPDALEEAKRLMLVTIGEPALQLGARVVKRSKSRVRLWQSHMAAHKPFVGKLHNSIGKVLVKWRHKLLKELPEAMPNRAVAGTVNKGVIGTIFDLTQFIADVRAAVDGQLPKTLVSAGKMALEEFGSDEDFGPRPEWIAEAIRERGNFITGAADAMHSRIVKHVEEGIETGEPMDDIAERVRGIFQACDRSSAMVIAQTETETAFSRARDASMHQAGVKFKEWLSAQDDRVRDTHQDADGQIVGLDENFNVGGVLMAHPHDEGAPAGEVVNCRCVTIAALKESPEE